MKKRMIALVLSSAMVLSLAACGGGGKLTARKPAAEKKMKNSTLTRIWFQNQQHWIQVFGQILIPVRY